MKLTTKYTQLNNYRDKITILLENNKGEQLDLRFCDGEPEDNTLSRNFGDCYIITDLVRMAYEAGKNGEEFEYDEN